MGKRSLGKIFISLLVCAVFIAGLASQPAMAEELGVAGTGCRWSFYSLAPPSSYNVPEYVPSSLELGENEQLAKQALAGAIMAGQSRVDLSAYHVTYEQFINLVNFVLFTEYPSLVGVSSYVYQIDSRGIIYQVKFSYHYSQQEIVARRAMVEQAADAVLAACVTPEMTELQKVKALHDYLLLNCTYDLESVSTGNPELFTAYGALVDKKAVCQGYAGAFQLFMNRLGIPCIMVFSEAMNHTWNMVQIGGEWYHVDATWDDPVPDEEGRLLYNNFMYSDNGIANGLNRHYSWESAGYTAGNPQYEEFVWSYLTMPVMRDSELSLDTRAYNGNAGSLYQFLAKGNTGEVTASSSNPQVASVSVRNPDDPRGILFDLTLKNPGQATILITSADGGLLTIPVISGG